MPVFMTQYVDAIRHGKWEVAVEMLVDEEMWARAVAPDPDNLDPSTFHISMTCGKVDISMSLDDLIALLNNVRAQLMT